MINSEMQTVCIGKMKDIINNYGKNSDLINISNENLEKTLQKIGDMRISASVILSVKVKHVLYNLDKYRTEIKTAFELQIFDLLQNELKSLEIENSQHSDLPQEPAAVEEVEAEVSEMSEEPAAVEEVEAEVSEMSEEPAVVEEVEAEVSEMSEEPAVVEEVEAEVSEMPEEPAAVEEVEAEVSEMSEEPAAVEEPFSEKAVDDSVSVEKTGLDEKEPEVEVFEEKEIEVQEKRSESLEILSTRSHEAQESFKKRKVDWFDFILDISGAIVNFFLKKMFRKKYR